MIISTDPLSKHLLGHHFQPDYDLFIAFLLLTHNFEYTFELGFLPLGVISDKIGSRCHRSQCVEPRGDLNECAPTIIVGVPLIWEMIRNDILGQVEKIPTESKPSMQPSASRWPTYLGFQRSLILWCRKKPRPKLEEGQSTYSTGV